MKKNNKILLSLLGIFLGISSLSAQIIEAPEWEFSVETSKGGAENSLNLSFEAEIPDGWYMYSSDFSEEVGPLVTEFSFNPSDDYQLQGEILPQGQQKKYDDLWEGEYTYFTGTARFLQEVVVKEGTPIFEGSISYQICSDETGQCIPYETPFRFNAEGESLLVEGRQEPSSLFSNSMPLGEKDLRAGSASSITGSNTGAQETEIPVVQMEAFQNPFAEGSEEPQKSWMGLLNFFLLSFAGGLAALLTPCVFPMIPMTVSYFTKSGSGSKGKMKAIIYGLFIIGINTLVWTLVTLIIVAGFANFMSTH